MQTTTPATRAHKPKAPAIPALMPLPRAPNVMFWAVAALNNDAELQAIEALQTAAYKKITTAATFTTRLALSSAQRNADDECKRSFRICRDEGALPFAWRGSRALVQALPSSLRGAA